MGQVAVATYRLDRVVARVLKLLYVVGCNSMLLKDFETLELWYHLHKRKKVLAAALIKRSSTSPIAAYLHLLVALGDFSMLLDLFPCLFGLHHAGYVLFALLSQLERTSIQSLSCCGCG